MLFDFNNQITLLPCGYIKTNYKKMAKKSKNTKNSHMDLGKINPLWDGFQLTDSHLVTPTNDKIPRNLLLNIEYYSYLQREIGWPAQKRCQLKKPENDNKVIWLNDLKVS
jgi:hypothetical protein